MQARNRKKELLGSASRRLFFETLEPRLLLSADLIPIQGSIAAAGEVDHHSFTLAADAHVALDSRTSGQLDWTLTGPRGTVASGQPASPTDPAGKSASSSLDLVSGTYTLSIAGVDNATGTYQFQLEDLTHAASVTPDVQPAASAGAGAPASGITVTSATTLSRLAFVPNQGQAAPGADFVATGQNYGLAISSSAWDLALASGNGNGAEVQMHLVGANPAAAGSGSQQLPGVTNYVNGTDASHNIMGLPSFARVQYAQVYQGIDLAYYGSNGKLEYDWTVAPGADPGTIGLQFGGASGLEIDAQGDLVIHTGAGDFVQQAPILYQNIGGQHVSVDGHYVIKDGTTVGFEVGPYDKSQALTIDPVLGYSDYLGGAGHDSVSGIATDKDGNTYVVGTTVSASFEGLETGAYHAFLGDEGVAFLSEYTHDGDLKATTLLGPAAKFDDSGYAYSHGDAVAVDQFNGSVYVAFDSQAGPTFAEDASSDRIALTGSATLHIAKFKSDGTPAWPTDVATSEFTDADLGTFRGVYFIGDVHIALDDTGAAYVSSAIFNQGNQDVSLLPFLEKVSAQGHLEFTRALSAVPDALAVEGANIYMAASTAQADLPVSANALRQANQNANPSFLSSYDIYVAELDSEGYAVAATYFGGSNMDVVGGLAVSPARPGVVYIAGGTASADFPVTSYVAGYNSGHPIDIENFDAFVSVIDLTHMRLLGSTLFGGSNQENTDPTHLNPLTNSGNDVFTSIAVDGDGRIYAAGTTNSPDLPLVSPIETELHLGDLMVNIGATYDFVVASFDADLTTLEFSTYLGGSGQESDARYSARTNGAFGGPFIAVSPDGVIHVAGETFSEDFWGGGAPGNEYAGDGDAVVIAIAQPPVVFGQTNQAGVGFPFSGIVASFDNTRPNAAPTDFTASIDWGDGTTSAGEVNHTDTSSRFDVVGSHQYNTIGDYPVVVRVTDTKAEINPQTAIDAGGLAGSQFEPTIAIDPSLPDRLFAAAVDEKGANDANAGTGGGIFVATSTDGGGRWSPRRIATDPEGEPLPAAYGAPKAVFDSFGNLFLTYAGAAGNEIVLALSTDGGLTFRKIGDFSPQGSSPGTDPNGDVLRSVDRPAIAVGPGSVWVTFADVADGGVAVVGASVTGLDHVSDFSESDFPNTPGDFGDIAVGPQGQVVVLWQQTDDTDTNVNVYTSLNPDGVGGEFGDPRLLATTPVQTPPSGFVPVNPIDYTLAWDPNGGGMGHLYVAYTRFSHNPNDPDPDHDDSDIYLRRSEDGGATWETHQVSDGPPGTFHFLPSIAIDPQMAGKSVAVGWYDTRTGDGTQAEYFVATSGDGGTTFSAGTRVSAGPSKGAAGDGFGEYSSLAYFDGVLHPVWVDNSAGLLGNQDLPSLDVATAVVGVIKVSNALQVEGDEVSGSDVLPFSGQVAHFVDPIDGFGADEYSASIDWGDGSDPTDGVIDQSDSGGFTVSGEHQYETDGTDKTYTITIQVTGPKSRGEATTQAEIEAADPLDVEGTPVSGAEQDDLSVEVAQFTDPNGPADASEYSATIDWGDDSDPSNGTIAEDQNGDGFIVTGEHKYETHDTYTVTVTVTGPHHSGGQATAEAEITDAPLSVEVKDDLKVVRETEKEVVVATLTDPDTSSNADDFTAVIDWGDGSPTTEGTLKLQDGSGENGAPNVFEISGKHKYDREAGLFPERTFGQIGSEPFHITVTVTEANDDPNSGDPEQVEATGSINSVDPPLTVNPGNFIDIEAQPFINTGFLQLAVFEPEDDDAPDLDLDPTTTTALGEYTVAVDWGDGNSDTDYPYDENGIAGHGSPDLKVFVTSKDLTVVGRHTYLDPGQYDVTISVNDDSGGHFEVTLLANVLPDVTGSVNVAKSGLVFNPAADLFAGDITITNAGSHDLEGPFDVVLSNIPDGVELVNVDARSGDGQPVIHIGQSRLQVGDSLDPIHLLFQNPDHVPINYTVQVFDGLRAGALSASSGLTFEPNRGQADGSVSYVAHGPDYAVGLAGDHAALVLAGDATHAGAGALMEWVGGNASPSAVALDPLPGVSNYFLGDKAINNVLHYGRVHYSSVYNGIGLDYYGRDGALEYDWIVSPGADASAISMRFAGVEHVVPDSAGNLQLQMHDGTLLQRAPVAYQFINGQRIEVTAKFTFHADGSVGFDLGSYDHKAALVIDPVLVYSTYLGATYTDSATAVAVDAQGNAYVTGWTTSYNFPTANAFQADPFLTGTLFSARDAFVTKLDASGRLVFSTYLGSGTNDYYGRGTVADAIAIDAAGHIFVGGGTDSVLFPAPNAAPLAQPPATFSGSHAFLTEFSADGARLLYSTVLTGYLPIESLAVDNHESVYAVLNTDGFNSNAAVAFKLDTTHNNVEWVNNTFDISGFARSIAVDNLGQAYIAGDFVGPATYQGIQIFPAANALFPTLPDYPGDVSYERHAFLAKLSASGEVEFNTLLGGSLLDGASSVAVDSDGAIYVGGSTQSPDLPVPGGVDSSLDGFSDGYLLKLSNDGRQLLYGTYLGGSGEDNVAGLALDAKGTVYVTGATSSDDLPTVHAHQPTFVSKRFDGDSEGFVAAIPPNGGSYDYLTYLAGEGGFADRPSAIAADSAGNVTVVGQTGSDHFPTRNAFQSHLFGTFPFYGIDAFVTRLGAGDAGTIALRNSEITVVEGNAFNGLVASFRSNGTETPDQFSAMIDWGDDTASAGTIAGNFSTGFNVSGQHLYPDIGDYDVRVTLRDSLGRPVTAVSTDPGFDQGHGRYHVGIDTAALAGTSGQLAFQFNPGAIPGGPDTQAVVSGLTVTGGTLGGAATEGDASVGPHGEMLLSPTAVLNRLIAGVTLGSKIEFDLDISGPGMTSPHAGPIADVFAVQLLSADGQNHPLLGADATGSVLRVDVNANGSTQARSSDSHVSVAALGHATVSDAPLHVDLLPFKVQEGLPFSGPVAAFTSANPLATADGFTSTIDWGDGSPVIPGAVAFDGTQFSISGTHVYREAGDYPLIVAITDPHGVVTTRSSSLLDPVQAEIGVKVGSASVLLSADFNHDGKLDLVTNALYGGGAAVLLGNGGFTFGAAIPIATTLFGGNLSIGAGVAADFNNDGFTDLALANGTLEIWLGHGDGTFTQGPAAPSFSGYPVTMGAGDFDGDGHTDLAIAVYNSPLIWTMLGNGDGSFQDPLANYGHYGLFNQVAVADLNNDGRSDILVASGGSSSLDVFIAGPGGTFGDAEEVSLGSYTAQYATGQLAVGDVTGDGIPDAVLGAGDLLVLAGTGTGGFSAPVHYATAVAPESITLGDFNNDGVADIVLADTIVPPNGSLGLTSGRIEILRSLPGGGFAASEPIVGSAYGTLSEGDWNGDGNLDVARNNAAFYTFAGSIFYPGRGDGTLQAPRTQLANEGTRALLTLDVNGDGFPDLVTGGPAGVTVSLGNASGTYDQPLQVPVAASNSGGGAYAVATGDLNGDGRTDLVGGTSAGLTISFQLADGTFSAPRNIYAGSAREVAVGDLNNDGFADIVAIIDNNVIAFLNDGAGSFSLSELFSAGTFPSSLLLSDLNGDGKLDVAAVLEGDYDGAQNAFVHAGVAVAMGNGDGTFAPVARYDAGMTYIFGASGSNRQLVSGDVNNDGITDIVAVQNGFSFYPNPRQGAGLFVLLGKPDGTFQSGPSYFTNAPGSELNSVALGDFDGDGNLDVAVAQNFGSDLSRHDDVLIMRGNGDGTFNDPQPLEAASTAGEIVAVDLNGDGKLDLIVAEQDILSSIRSGLNVLIGNGDGTFKPRVTYAAGDSAAIALADFDHDGKADHVVTADFAGNAFAVVGIRGDGTLRAPLFTRTDESPLLIQTGSIYSLVPTDVNGDGKVDLAVRYGFIPFLQVDAGGYMDRAGADEVGILISNGDGTFALRPTALIPNYGSHSNAPHPLDLAVTDLAGDGKLEMLVGSEWAGILATVPLSSDGIPGDPVRRTGFANDLSYFGNGSYVYGDFNEDGRLDAGWVTDDGSSDLMKVTVLEGQSDFSFVAGPTATFGGTNTHVFLQLHSAVAADVNRDGHLDLAIGYSFLDVSNPGVPGTQTGRVTVLLGAGDGSFQAPLTYAEGVPVSGLTAADLNGDGSIDLAAVAGVRDRARNAVVLYNDGTGGFDNYKIYDTNSPGNLSLFQIAAADLAGDGYADIVISDFYDRNLRIIDLRPPQGATVSEGALYLVATNLNAVAGQSFTAVVGTLTDDNPLATAAGYAASIDWGDGTTSAGSVSSDGHGGFRIIGTHTYADAGMRTVTVQASEDTVSARASASANVSDTGIAASPAAFRATAGTAFNGVVATFTDTDANASAVDFSTTIDWGDGQTSIGTVAADGQGGFKVTGLHTYVSAGTFSVPVGITAIDGETAATVSAGTVAGEARHAPAARDDSYVINEGTVLSAIAGQGILANDSDADGDSLTAQLVSGAQHGTLALLADGSFTYRPAANFIGSDSFSYRAWDGSQTSNLATVLITVKGVNAAPVAANDTATTDEDAPVVINVLANDHDSDGTLVAATVVFTSEPGHGVVSADPTTGAITYTPATNFFGADSFTYKVRDNSGALSNEALVSMTVRAQNDAPVAVRDTYVVNEDSAPFTVSTAQGLLANDTDADGNTLTASLVGGPAHGTLDLHADGSFSYTPAPDFTGSDSFRYHTSDGSTFSNTVAVSLLVQSTDNDPPVLAAIADQRTSEGVAFSVSGSFADPDRTDAWTATVDFGDGLGAQPLQLDGKTFTLTHSYGESGSYQATVRVSDRAGETSTPTPTFNVVVDNPRPVVDAGADRTVGRGVSVQVKATFTDAPLDTHTATIDWGDGSGPVTARVKELNGAGNVSGTHSYAADGDYTVTVSVSDDEGATGSNTLKVKVNGALVDAGPDRTVHEGELVILPTVLPGDFFQGQQIQRLSGSFVDLDPTETHTATVDWGDGTPVESAPVFEAQFGPSGAPTGVSGVVQATHAYGDNGLYTVLVSIRDSQGGVASSSFDMTVLNLPPDVHAGPDQTLNSSSTASISASFSDAGVRDTETASIDWGDGTSTSGVVHHDGIAGVNSGTVTGTHTYAQTGSYTVTVSVTDKDNGTGSDTLSIAVGTNVTRPDAPVMTEMADLAASTEIKGTGKAGTTVKVYDNGGSTPIATGIIDTNGKFDVTTAARLAQGTHVLTATVTDGGTTSAPSTAVTDVVKNVGTDGYSITTDISFTLAQNEHYLTFLGSADLTGTGTGTKVVLAGNTGHNTFVGGPGDNDYFVRHSTDTITATLNAGYVNRVYADVSFTLPANVQELVLLGSGNLTGTGNSLANVIYSNSGLDTLIGGGGNDTFIVHNGSDQVIALADGGTNAVFADVSFTMPANVRTLVLMGSGNLTGIGNNLGDTIYSNTGVDTLIGGTGTNSFVVHNSNDVVIASPQSPKNTIFADVSFTLSSNVQDLVLFGSANATGTGNDLDNTITANNGNGRLRGGGGNDTFIPGPGQNIIDGGSGINSIVLGGLRSNYRTTGLTAGGIQIADQREGAPDGTSTVASVQYFQFKDMTLTPSPPTVTVSDKVADHGQTFAASSLFSVTDPLVDTMATYAFWDTGSGNGHFTLDGVEQGTGREIDVTAAQLPELVYHSGSGADVLAVRANNGFQWSAWSPLSVTAPVDGAPVMTPVNASISASRGESYAGSGLFNVNDPDRNDIAAKYDFVNIGAGGGHFVLNGVDQGSLQEIYVAASELGQLTYRSSGVDAIFARANDGILWGPWSQPIVITAPTLTPATLDVRNLSGATRGQPVPLSSLLTISDPDGASYQKLQLIDLNGTVGGGRLVVNGVPQTGLHVINLAPGDLSSTVFDVGTLGGTDTLYAQLLQTNGQGSGWKAFTVTAPVAQLPTLSVSSDANATRGQPVPLSSLLTITDPDSVSYQSLELIDLNGTAWGGQFVINGVPQQGLQVINVAPGDVASTVFHVGSLGGTDTLYAQLLESNGQVSGWKSFSVTAPLAALPTLSVSSKPDARHGEIVPLSSLLTINDPDGAGYQKLQLVDVNGTALNGQLVINGVPQTGGHVIELSSSDLANTLFRVGTLGGSDTLYAQLLQSNGQGSGWKSFTVTAPLAQLPTLTAHDHPSATPGQAVPLSTLVTIADPDNVGFQKLELFDTIGTAAGGQLVIDGAPQTGGHVIEVSPSGIANTVFNVGTHGGTDTVYVQLLQINGQASGWVPVTIKAAGVVGMDSLPDDETTSLDATFTSAGGVKSVAFRLDYDPELVTVTDAELGAGLPDSARVTLSNAEGEDGAEATITITSEEPIPAGTVRLASVSIASRHSGGHSEGLRKLHVHGVNRDSRRMPDPVRISMEGLALSSSETTAAEQEQERDSYQADYAPKVRLRLPPSHPVIEPAPDDNVARGDGMADPASIATAVRLAQPEFKTSDAGSAHLGHSQRWSLDRNADHAATSLPQQVRIPLATLAAGRVM